MNDIESLENLKSQVKRFHELHNNRKKTSAYIKNNGIHKILSDVLKMEVDVAESFCILVNDEDIICPFCGRKKHYSRHSKSLTCEKDCAGTVEKRKKTCLERYGADNPMKNELIKNKQIETIKTKYNVDNPSKNEKIKLKRKKTNLQRYGSSSPLGNRKIREKIAETMRRKYGAEIPLQSEIIKEKTKNTNLERYGHEWALSAENVRRKIEKTLVEKYGSHYKRVHYNELALRFADDEEFARMILEEKKHIMKIASYLQISKDTVAYTLKKHGIYDQVSRNYKTSIYEEEIFNFIAENYHGTIEKTNRDIMPPYEVDIYIPSKNIAIEFNGIFWHSDFFKSKNYHYEKFIMAKNNGIRLIQIFEDEWVNNKEKCKNVLYNLINENDVKKIAARKCKVDFITARDYRRFLDNFHLQGYAPAAVKIGLYCKEELISIISFGKKRICTGNRQKESHSYEIVRYCVRPGYRIVGGLEKMLSFFVKSYPVREIMSFVDNRWFSGISLARCGFEFRGYTPPNYWYVDLKNISRIHRFSMRKNKLVEKYKDIVENIESKSESQITRELGIPRIWDAGNSKWVKTFS